MTQRQAPGPGARLGELARIVGAELGVGPGLAGPDVVVTDVHHDHRSVTPGSLFACIRGANTDGHDHARAAVEAGAVALLCERVLGLGVPELRVAGTRAAVGPVAAAVHGHPAESLDLVAITGTNGKTTVAGLVDGIAATAGRVSATIGTLSGVRTTPEAADLQRQLATMVREGVTTVAIEVSSHALDMRRVDGMLADVAVFTNLSRDHLDHHGTMDAYFQAKARLFEPALARAAVVNLDDPHGRLLADAAQVPTRGVSLSDVDELEVHRDHSTFRWRGRRVRLGLAGRFNVSNALLAAVAAEDIGVDLDGIVEGLAQARPQKGRFERVDIAAPFDVVVDFAHTPDALEHVLTDAREVADRTIVVFGCGGDRDPGKRAPMGAVAARLADLVIVTSDNPRTEAPETIIADILEGVAHREGVEVEPDRRRAIALGLEAARPGDLVVIAGKGHETEQIVGDRRLPFDDRVVVVEEHQRLLGTQP